VLDFRPQPHPFTALGTTTTIDFQFRTNGVTHWYLDDVSGTPRGPRVPDHGSSLAPLALGCLALGASRRELLAS
jgi:hypothetical protein